MSESDPREKLYSTWCAQEAERFPDADPLTIHTVLNFLFTYQLLEGFMHRVVLESGLSLSACNVLSILYHQEGQCAPLHEIGQLLITSKANITGLVDGLVEKGLLERTCHPTDRRVKLARLLPPGQEFVERWIPNKHRHLQQALSGLSEADKRTLLGLLGKVRESVLQCE